jgi:HTH-type transcriptional regulator, competence development regulator
MNVPDGQPAAFGQRLRELRKAKFLSQKQLAEMVGLDFTYLSKVETGAMPPPAEATIRKLADALHVPAESLIALAGRLSEDQSQIVSRRSDLIPDLFRAIGDSKITDEQLKALIAMLKSCSPEKK